MKAKPRVVVLGGGFGGLESAFYLRHKLGEKVALTLVSDRDYFLFKPNTIYIPFGEDPAKLEIPLERPARRKGIELVRGSARRIEPLERKVVLEDERISYDFLIVATGAGMRPTEIPGLAEHAVTIWTPAQMLRLRNELGRLADEARGGTRRTLLFLVPPNNRCAGPLYELTLMTDTWLRQAGVREEVDVTLATCEEGYIQAFGPRLNTVIAHEFDERGVRGLKGHVAIEVEPGVVSYQNGERTKYDLLVSFPPYVAAERFESLPIDDRGFVRVDPDSRRVKDQPHIFAVGDAADFPVKQAFLALLQADAAADHLAAEISGRPPSVDFEPMSMCVMEELNKATFAQVPMRYTDDPLRPVAVDTEDTAHYKVGVSPIWRIGKKALGLYLPWRFGAGEPFHAGLAWEAMDLGLKVMSKALAR